MAELNRILRYDNVLDWLKQPASARTPLKPSVVNDKLPSEEHHGWKYLAFGPDGYIRYGLDDPLAALASRTASFNEYLHHPPWAPEWVVHQARELRHLAIEEEPDGAGDQQPDGGRHGRERDELLLAPLALFFAVRQ